MDTGDLRRVLDHQGPFATAHLDDTHDSENARHERELRWRAARGQLAAAGADEATLTALDRAVADAPPPAGRAGRLLVGAGGEVLLDRTLPGPPPTPLTRVGALPYLLPLVELDAGTVPYVAALVDRIGADVHAVDAWGREVTSASTEGEDHPVHKTRGGGWAHLRIQHHVEEVVRRNVRAVADELTRLVDLVGARLLAVAGDVGVLAELRDALPPRCHALLVEPKGRREASSEFDEIVAGLAAERARAANDEVVDRFVAQLRGEGPDRLAVQGIAETVAALREGNVAAVVISDPTLAGARVWTGAEPTMVALREDELRAIGVTDGDRERADEALPAAAVYTGADLVSTAEPVRLTDGVGALLRHT